MKKIFVLLIAAVALTLSSCQKFLETPVYGENPEISTQDQIERTVYGLMSVYDDNTGGEGVTGRGIAWFEAASDNTVPGRNTSQAYQIRRFQMDSQNGRDAKNTWPAMYQINKKANDIIGAVPGLNLDPTFANWALGNAYFWRGLAMLWIAPYYADDINGGIPIILDTTPLSEYDAPRPKSALDNYKQIIADFDKAAGYLPLLSEQPLEQRGMAWKGAAWGFAARAALYAAQYDKSYYNTCISYCNKVMGLTGEDKRDIYTDGTGDDYANLFTRANNFSCEYLYSLVGNVNKDGPKYHGMSFENGGFRLYNTWGYFNPTLNLWKSYEDGDKRRDATILYPGHQFTFVGRTFTYGESRTYRPGTDTGLAYIKFLSPWHDADCVGKEVSSDGNFASNTLGMVLIRFADILLMKAECLIATNGEGDSEAKILINKVRARAGLPEDSDATMAQLQHERRVELAFEYMPSRFHDLVRWGIAKEVCAQPTLGVKLGTVGNYDTISEFEFEAGRDYKEGINQVFAIPSTAFRGTVNLKQNVGYE